ncbi:unnamed protein product, partial [Onchocerca ochengi]|uniref:Transposase n=1 Tax=Onchocerca ochengi TaxID=42157 RepID=A0A182ESD4_ONCOC
MHTVAAGIPFLKLDFITQSSKSISGKLVEAGRGQAKSRKVKERKRR